MRKNVAGGGCRSLPCGLAACRGGRRPPWSPKLEKKKTHNPFSEKKKLKKNCWSHVC